MTTNDKCFACDRALGRKPKVVDTRDAQFVHVGVDCFRKIVSAGDSGYQPPKGGPKLYALHSSLPWRIDRDNADGIEIAADNGDLVAIEKYQDAPASAAAQIRANFYFIVKAVNRLESEATQ